MCKSRIMQDNRNKPGVSDTENLNSQQEGNDKAPGEERGKGEQVTPDDLKGKKIDADPSLIPEQPIRELP